MNSLPSPPKWHRGIGNGCCGQFTTCFLCCSFLLTLSSHSPHTPVWGSSHRRQLSMVVTTFPGKPNTRTKEKLSQNLFDSNFVILHYNLLFFSFSVIKKVIQKPSCTFLKRARLLKRYKKLVCLNLSRFQISINSYHAMATLDCL